LLKPEFGVSQPHFAQELPRLWISETAAATYAMVSSLQSQIRLVEMCLAQLIFHRAMILQWDPNHVTRSNCQLFRNSSLMEAAVTHTHVIYPWDQTAAQFGFTGIPPHVAILHQLQGICTGQRSLVNQFTERMTVLLDARGMDGGAMTEARLREVVLDATRDLRERLENLPLNPTAPQEEPTVHAHHHRGPNQRYTVHYYKGRYHVLPQTWRFPSAGVLMMWQQWLLGDYVQNIPPLKILSSNDVVHLDALPLAAGEKRRPARKVLADLRFVMMYIEMKVREADRWTDEHNATSIAQMFRAVEHHFIIASSNRSHN
jgi:hypothetical protein